MTTSLIHHHGDVVFIPVDTIPKNAQETERDERGRIVVAEGEVTGHAHAITAPTTDVSLYELIDVQDMPQRFLKVEKEVELEHEEHGRMKLPPGTYEARIAREWDPLQGARRVQD